MPDKLGVKPNDYFDYNKAKDYETNKTIIKVQLEISKRLEELLNLEKGKFLLELGCGTGITSKYFLDKKYFIIGLDISTEMLKFANNKGIDVINADFSNIPFRNEIFDIIISISSLQWVWGSSREEVINKYDKIIKEIKRVSKKSTIAGVQFYPNTEKEFDIVTDIFKKNGFRGNIIIDNWKLSKKRKKYIILNLEK